MSPLENRESRLGGTSALRFPATYYDGRSALSEPVSVLASPDGTLQVEGAELLVHASLAQARLENRLGHTRRFIHLASGATLETGANEAVDQLLAQYGPTRSGQWVHWLEQSWPSALVALLATVAAIWALITIGVPAAAEQLAHRVPAEMEQQMGSQALNALDHRILQPTTLTAAQAARVAAVFDSLNDDSTVHLEIRSAPRIGANALALPSGIVVITDDLIALARTDDELAAVIAHELGHVQNRHIMRSLIQNSATALLLATLVGDLSSIAGLSATLPAFLMEAKYSREFELEADRHAATLMATHGRDLDALTRILLRLDQSAGEPGENQADSLVAYLSSHPTTAKRVRTLKELIEKAKQGRSN